MSVTETIAQSKVDQIGAAWHKLDVQIEPHPRRKMFTPEPKSPCLCGSGKRYQSCCSGRLPGFNNGKRWRQAAAEKRWTEMVRHLRADVTQYTIWHLDHTAPAVARKPELRFAYFMNIDIAALNDLVGDLMWGYARRGWLDRLPAMLDRLKSNIDDSRWLKKIAYHRAIAALWSDDRPLAAAEIAPLQPISPVSDDVELLQLHVDLHGSAMGTTERLSFFDRIRAISESPSDKLQYGGARSFELLLIDDTDGARKSFDEVIAAGRAMEEEMPFSATAELWFCRSLEGRAVLDSDGAMFNEIVERLKRQLNDPDSWTRIGRSHVLRNLGDVQRYAGAFEGAIQAYRASDALVAAHELRTFEAECELGLGNIDEAYRLIRSVSVDRLDPPERADHAFTSFYIALKRGDRQSLLDARSLLTSATTPQPHFEKRRLRSIITIGDAIEALAQQKPLPELGPIVAGLKKLSRYVQLNPNFNGLGINGNAMIDDYIARVEDRHRNQIDDTPTYPDDGG